MSKCNAGSDSLCRENSRLAKQLWHFTGSRGRRKSLRELTTTFGFSIRLGELLLLEGRWYVTHAGLLRLAHRRHCLGITTSLQRHLSDSAASRWVFKATVYKSPGSKGFVGYGDADPSNVSSLVSGAEMRVAETRAVNRALRKAYGIGLCSVEELGSLRRSSMEPASVEAARPQSGLGNGNGSNGHGRLRDRLCLLVRQHRLDPALVKRYAAEFCGTAALRDSSREQVEAFINHLSKWAAEDRDGLVCKLNSFAPAGEVTP
jgi:hypothetical protein